MRSNRNKGPGSCYFALGVRALGLSGLRVVALEVTGLRDVALGGLALVAAGLQVVAVEVTGSTDVALGPGSC